MSYEMVKLGDIASYINGFAFKPVDWSTKGLPIIRIQNLTKREAEFNYFEAEYKDRYEINNGDILVSWSATLGVFEWNRGKSLLNQHIFKVVFDKLSINKKFFVYLIDKELNNLVKNTHGSTMKHITKKRFDEHKVPLPPLETQKKLVEILDKAQKLIDQRKEQIKEMDSLIQSLFYDMFGDPVRNPMGWEVKTFSNGISEIKYGTGSPPIFCESGIPFVRATNIKNGRIVESQMKYLSKDEASKIEKCKLTFGDFIIVRSGANTGDAAYTPENHVGSYGGYDIIVKLSNSIDPIFINNLFLTNFKLQIIEPLTRRAAQPHLNANQINNMPIIFPPIALQNTFAERVKHIEQQKEYMTSSLKELEDNFNCLMQKAFKGELVD